MHLPSPCKPTITDSGGERSLVTCHCLGFFVHPPQPPGASMCSSLLSQLASTRTCFLPSRFSAFGLFLPLFLSCLCLSPVLAYHLFSPLAYSRLLPILAYRLFLPITYSRLSPILASRLFSSQLGYICNGRFWTKLSIKLHCSTSSHDSLTDTSR